MRYIKRIKELFDTQELKNYYEVDYLSGRLNAKDLVKSVVNDEYTDFKNLKQTDFQKIHTILINEDFLFFNAPLNNFKRDKIVETTPKAYTYIFIENNWYISFTLAKTNSEQYTSCIVFKSLLEHTDGNVFGFENYVKGKACVEIIQNVNIKQVVYFINNRLIKLMKHLKFDEHLKYNKETTK